jgi:hypothetical protein
LNDEGGEDDGEGQEDDQVALREGVTGVGGQRDRESDG